MWQRTTGVGESFGLGVAGVPAVPQGRFDTGLAPERDRVAYYRAMLQGLVCAATPVLPAEAPLRVRVRNGQFGEALFAHFDATPHRIERDRSHTRAAPSGCYFLLRQTGEARTFLEVGDREHALGPGDCLLGDADTPFVAREAGPLGFSLYLLPKWMVDPGLTGGGRDRLAASLVTPAASPLGAMMGAWLGGMPGPGLAAPTAAALGAMLGRLAAIAAQDGAASDEPAREALRAARARQVLAQIERRFTEPDFGAATAAEALRISIRSLHLAMEPTGATFSEALMARRLAEARAQLAAPGGRTVLEIAFACGFNDLSTFYRAFRRTFGAPPRDLRPG